MTEIHINSPLGRDVLEPVLNVDFWEIEREKLEKIEGYARYFGSVPRAVGMGIDEGLIEPTAHNIYHLTDWLLVKFFNVRLKEEFLPKKDATK